MRQLTLLLLIACRTDSEKYAAGLAAETWSEASAQCAGMSVEPGRSDCLTAATEIHARPLSDCTQIADARWQQECIFMFAERAGKQGDLVAAFDACERTPEFGRQCSYHLIRDAARQHADQPPNALADVVAPYRSLKRAPDAELLFWKAYYRERLKNGTVVDPTGCPVVACEQAANDEIRSHLPRLMAATPNGCDVPESELGTTLWAANPLTAVWIKQWKSRFCAGAPPVPEPSKGPPPPTGRAGP